MDERVMQFRVGVMVLATLIITAILVLIFGELPSLIHGTYTIYIKFPQAPGVTKDTPVRKSGILIGRVTDVQLPDEGGVLVTARIDANRRLFHNENCRINSLLLGDAVLQFSPSGDPKAARTLVREGETLSGVAAPDAIQVITDMQANLSGVMGSVSKTSDEMGRVAAKVSDLLDENKDRINRIIDQADQSLKIMRSSMESANDIIADPQVRSELKKAIAQVPDLLRETRETVSRMKQTFDLVDQNLRDIQGITRPLGQRGEVLVDRVDHTLEDLGMLVSQLNKFSRALNSEDSSLGQLVHNPDLYQHLNRTAMRLDELTQELRPIIHDARVFSDKIARHPESLGVRGMLERNPGIK